MKRIITNWTFVASTKKITFDDLTTVELHRVGLITNVTDGIVIFNPFDPLKTGIVSTNVLTLTFDTSSPLMADGDALQIFYDDGDVLHDKVDVGWPMKMGHKAIAHGANPAAVAAGDRTDWYASRHGVPFVIGGHPSINTFEYNTTNVNGETDDSILGAISNRRVVITMIDATCDNANTNDTGVRIGFGDTVVPAEPSSGTGIVGIVLSHSGIAPGSGVVKGSGAGIIAIGGLGKELRITNDDPGGKLRVVVTYYTIES